MLHLSGLFDELERSAPAQAAMALLESALARRSGEEQRDFWRAIEIYYVSRKAPPEMTLAPASAVSPVGLARRTPGRLANRAVGSRVPVGVGVSARGEGENVR